MNRKDPITIECVANGFIVTPAVNPNHTMVARDETHVFNRIEELQAWLAEHFSPPSTLRHMEDSIHDARVAMSNTK